MKLILHLITVFMSCNILLFACSGANSPPNIISANVAEAEKPSETMPVPTTSLQKFTYKIGPFSLPAESTADLMRESPGILEIKFDEPVWMTSFNSVMEDKHLLYMTILTNGSEQNPLCAEKQVANPFVVVTAVNTEIKFPDRDGYAILPEDKITAKAILQNPTTEDLNNIYFSFTLTVVPMKTAKNFNDVMPLFLNIDPCNFTPITLPPKEFVKKSADFIVPEDGYLTNAYGLLQDYGVNVSLSNGAGSVAPFWTSQAVTSEDHKLIGLPPFEDPAGIPFKAGDKIGLSVAYENRSDVWQNNATGAVMAYLRRTKEDGGGKKKDVGRGTWDVRDVQALLLKCSGGL